MSGATGEWRRLHNNELYVMYRSPDIVWITQTRRMRRVGHVARTGKRMGTYRILVGKGEGNKPLGKLGYRWEEILKKS
jgi:hypothetical protein